MRLRVCGLGSGASDVRLTLVVHRLMALELSFWCSGNSLVKDLEFGVDDGITES